MAVPKAAQAEREFLTDVDRALASIDAPRMSYRRFALRPLSQTETAVFSPVEVVFSPVAAVDIEPADVADVREITRADNDLRRDSQNLDVSTMQHVLADAPSNSPTAARSTASYRIEELFRLL